MMLAMGEKAISFAPLDGRFLPTLVMKIFLSFKRNVSEESAFGFDIPNDEINGTFELHCYLRKRFSRG